MLLDIKNVHLVQKHGITSKRIFKVSLSLTLMVFVFTMSPLPILNPVSAAALTNVLATPSSNIVNESANYNFFFKTSTTATINKIEISFPSSFDLSGIRFIESNNIGSGKLSVAGSTLTYTLTTAESVPAGITIKLELGRIIATAEGSFTVSIKTLNSADGTIDGPTTSSPFTIKSITSSDIADNTITGSDISPGFMIKKTLLDDAAGNAAGWNPDGTVRFFVIIDNDVTEGTSMVQLAVEPNVVSGPICMLQEISNGRFSVNCPFGFETPLRIPQNTDELHYTITNLPAHVVTSSLSASPSSTSLSSSTISSPFDSIGTND